MNMKFVNKNTGDIINSEVYFQLSESAKLNFVRIKDEEPKTTTTIVKNESDSMSVGDGIAAAALIPFVAIAAFFGD